MARDRLRKAGNLLIDGILWERHSCRDNAELNAMMTLGCSRGDIVKSQQKPKKEPHETP